MNRVEFFGVPGVGKSTLYKSLISRNKGKSYITEADAKLLTESNIIFKNKNFRNKYVIKILNKFYRLKLFKRVEKFNFYDFIVDKEKYNDLFEIVLKFSSIKDRQINRRLLGAHWFMGKFENVIMYENYPLDDLVVLDESLMQKIFSLIEIYDKNYENEIHEYFLNLPKPAGIIACNTSIEKIMQRILKRSKNGVVRHIHLNKSRKELESVVALQNKIYEVGTNIMIKRGVSVKQVNLDVLSDNLVLDVETFLDSI